ALKSEFILGEHGGLVSVIEEDSLVKYSTMMRYAEKLEYVEKPFIAFNVFKIGNDIYEAMEKNKDPMKPLLSDLMGWETGILVGSILLEMAVYTGLAAT